MKYRYICFMVFLFIDNATAAGITMRYSPVTTPGMLSRTVASSVATGTALAGSIIGSGTALTNFVAGQSVGARHVLLIVLGGIGASVGLPVEFITANNHDILCDFSDPAKQALNRKIEELGDMESLSWQEIESKMMTFLVFFSHLHEKHKLRNIKKSFSPVSGKNSSMVAEQQNLIILDAGEQLYQFSLVNDSYGFYQHPGQSVIAPQPDTMYLSYGLGGHWFFISSDSHSTLLVCPLN